MSYWDGSRWVAGAVAPTTPRRRPHRIFGAAAEAGLITLLMFGLIAGTTFAAKGGQRGGGSTPTGTCDVAPSPVTVGEQFFVTARDVRPDTVFTVRVTDANGTQVFFLGSDASGTGTGSSYAYATGAHSVEVTYSERRKTVVAAACSFVVS